MDRHVQRLGIWSMVFGIAATLGSLLVLWYFGSIYAVFNYSDDQRLGFIATALLITHLLLGPPCIVCGYFLMRFDDRARMAMIPVCAMNLLNPPVGTALAVYGLWVLFMPETDPLFSAHGRRGKLRAPARNRRTIGRAKSPLVGSPPKVKTVERTE